MDQEALKRAAIGPRAEHYLGRWARMDSGGKRSSWNWAACLLNVFWFAYRKMWGPMLAMGAAYIVASPFLDPTDRRLFRVTVMSLIALSFLTGSYGNWLYRRQVERLIARSGGGDTDADRLAKKGGVSIPAAIAALVGLTALSAAAGAVAAAVATPD